MPFHTRDRARSGIRSPGGSKNLSSGIQGFLQKFFAHNISMLNSHPQPAIVWSIPITHSFE